MQLPGGYALGPNGLSVPPRPNFKDAGTTGLLLAGFERLSQKALGDWFRDVKQRWPQTYSQLLDTEHFKEETLRHLAWVTERVPATNWMLDQGVSFSAHAAVASLAPPEQRRILAKVADDHITLDEVRRAVRRIKRARVASGTHPRLHDIELTVMVTVEADTAGEAEDTARAAVKAALDGREDGPLTSAKVILVHAKEKVA
jgi:hypothetical protein